MAEVGEVYMWYTTKCTVLSVAKNKLSAKFEVQPPRGKSFIKIQQLPLMDTWKLVASDHS